MAFFFVVATCLAVTCGLVDFADTFGRTTSAPAETGASSCSAALGMANAIVLQYVKIHATNQRRALIVLKTIFYVQFYPKQSASGARKI